VRQTKLNIQNRIFLQGKTKCPVCGHKFKYTLPLEAMLVWEHYCSVCSGSIPGDLPEKGKMVFATIEYEEWA
jgi:hypothetical protein